MSKNSTGGVAQDESPEFKPQYCQKKKQKTKAINYVPPQNT
jgi:hypothetical protein